MQDVADGNRVDRIFHPLRDRNHRETVADVTQHLERRRAGAEDQRRADPHHFRTALDSERLGHFRPTGQVFGQLPVIRVLRDEAAQVDDATHIGVLGSGGDIAGRGAVGIAEAGLTDGVDQVVDDVDRSGSGERRANRLGIGGVQRYRSDVVKPPHPGKPDRVTGGGQHLMADRE